MKTISRSLALIFLLTLIAFPALVPEASAVSAGGFCRGLEARQKAISQNLNRGLTAYKDAGSKINESMNKRSSKAQEDLADAREKADELRTQSYRLIRDKQDTEELKNRAAEFADEVDVAVRARREAYDLARSQYREKVMDTLLHRGDNVRQGAEAFIAKSSSALSEAVEACKNGSEDETVIRDNLIRNLGDERVNYGDLLRSRGDYRTIVNDAINDKEKAYEDATRIFERTMQDIRAKYSDLKS